MSLSMLQHDSTSASASTSASMFGNNSYNCNHNCNSALHLQLQQQQQQQQREKDRHVLHLNNRACVLVLSKGDNYYSEANKLFDSALMIHKEQTEEKTSPKDDDDDSSSFALEAGRATTSLPCGACDMNINMNLNMNMNINMNDNINMNNTSAHSYDPDFSEGDLDDYDDFGEMDCDYVHNIHNVHTSIDSQLQQEQQQQQQMQQFQQTQTISPQPQRSNNNKIARMTSFSRLQSISYSGQQEYHQEKYGQQQFYQHQHQVYSLPIVMEESEWENAPTQDKSFVLIFNTALCNHLWGMQLMQQYLEATANNNNINSNIINNTTNSSNSVVVVPSQAMAQHCRETLMVSKLLYKLALENSVSFANGVDKMCYVALYNNLSHVCKTLEGYESMEAQWCDDMLLKAIFWWRDSTQHRNNSNNSNNNSNGNNNYYHTNHNSSSAMDMYLDDDVEIMDAFFDNVYYRIGVPEDIAPAAAA